MMNANFAGLAFVYLYLIGFKQARPKIHIPHLRLEMVLEVRNGIKHVIAMGFYADKLICIGSTTIVFPFA